MYAEEDVFNRLLAHDEICDNNRIGALAHDIGYYDTTGVRDLSKKTGNWTARQSTPIGPAPLSVWDIELA